MVRSRRGDGQKGVWSGNKFSDDGWCRCLMILNRKKMDVEGKTIS